MMEPQLTIENIPFFWGIAFIVNMLVGLVTFMLVVRRNVPSSTKGVLTWIGWWSWASALSLIINFVSGPDTVFSYHQIGLFTETMTNIGMIFWGIVYAYSYWELHESDWHDLEKRRVELSCKNRKKAAEQDSN